MTKYLHPACKSLSKLRSKYAELRAAQDGAVVIIFAFASVVLLAVVGAGLDYSRAALAQSRLRNAADQAVLASAAQLSLANTTDQSIIQSTTAFIQSLIGPAPNAAAPDQIDVQVINNRTAVQATVTRTVILAFGKILNHNTMAVKVQTSAQYLNKRPPLCVLTLDPSGTQSFLMQQTGTIQAPNCAVYANSTSPSAIAAQSTSLVKASWACSVGGYSGSTTNFSPVPQTGCPVLSDPLQSRLRPAVGTCTGQTTNVTIMGGTQTLQPGTYCGGITIKKGAIVTFAAGEYILNGGQLWVTGGSAISGSGVGFYFTNGASLAFDAASTVSLSAPASGSLVSLLFFQDPSAAAGKDTFDISSDNAAKLEGTIYLPKGRLWIGSNKPLAQSSAYTILVAYELAVAAGPIIYLNTNYGASNVPVPAGIITSSNSQLSSRLIQ